MIRSRIFSLGLSVVALIAVVLPAIPVGAQDVRASADAVSSDQSKDVHDLEKGAIDLFKSRQSVGAGAFENSAGSKAPAV